MKISFYLIGWNHVCIASRVSMRAMHHLPQAASARFQYRCRSGRRQDVKRCFKSQKQAFLPEIPPSGEILALQRSSRSNVGVHRTTVENPLLIPDSNRSRVDCRRIRKSIRPQHGIAPMIESIRRLRRPGLHEPRTGQNQRLIQPRRRVLRNDRPTAG